MCSVYRTSTALHAGGSSNSNWYQRRWGDRVQLDYTQIAQFDNFAGGNRRAMSFSSVTGFGADIIVVDDAHDIENVELNVIREATLRVWDEVLPNAPQRSQNRHVH